MSEVDMVPKIHKKKRIYHSQYKTNAGRNIHMEVWVCVVEPLRKGDKRQGTLVSIKIDNINTLSGISILNPNDLYNEDVGIKEAIKQCCLNMFFSKEALKDIWDAILEDLSFRHVVKSSIRTAVHYEKYGKDSLLNRLDQTEITFNES